MTTDEVMKMVTDVMKENGASSDEIAKIEIAIQYIEYIGNPDFRKKLEDYVFEATYNK